MYVLEASIVAFLVALPTALACLGYEGGVPVATSAKTNNKYIEVKAGQIYDGGWARFDRGSGSCTGGEGGRCCFLLRRGATLRNAIIGKNQKEGVHCYGSCTIEFVWFEDVCEDAISVKNDRAGDHTWIVGGGAYKAGDKIVQHNGCGTVNIINFHIREYGKVYRSCDNVTQRLSGGSYGDGRTMAGGEVVGINSNYGDTATLRNVCTDARVRCQMYNGCAGGCEPSKSGVCSG
ncbi:pectate lyase F [Colletotrichum navitas]|uniref:Pectate lyase n=1 Tax=Colletotrichum navitas TaxID=681940 RepID=A0AAD8Q0H2_9PEZI|nr:pectate lyase F [Colletotrichum navitas]KAK1593527.1 pectate lyase F [Colletotrichum navitas]